MLAEALRKRPSGFLAKRDMHLSLQANPVGDAAATRFAVAIAQHLGVLKVSADDTETPVPTGEGGGPHLTVDLCYCTAISAELKAELEPRWRRYLKLQ